MLRKTLLCRSNPRAHWLQAGTRRRPRWIRQFARDEDGAMIIFCVMMFGLMLALGGLSFDLMRYETHRDRLQATLDRAVLAAAALSQTRDPKQVVLDYFEKANMEDYITASDIQVTNIFGARRVEAKARIHVPLHHGNFAVFNGSEDSDGHQVLIAEAVSVAEESIGDVEISMVLDISGSMGWGDFNNQNRMENLKDAAQDFLDTVYDNSAGGTITTSIIPYTTQVSAGPTLLSYFNRNDSHEESHCLNFEASDFQTTTMDPISPTGTSTYYEQTMHFDPWTDEYDDQTWEVGNGLDYLNYEGWFIDYACLPNSEFQIIPWGTNKDTLKTYIEAFQPNDNTSTDIGVKWGAALLDPSLQSVVTGMISSGDVDSSAAGRPYAYTDTQTMKVMVVMTDGDNTSQFYMGDYRTGDSYVWKYQDGDNVFYSAWPHGDASEPDLNYETWSDGTAKNKWWVAYNWDFDGTGDTLYDWVPTPYDGDTDYTDNGVDAVRMTWDEVWREIPPEYLTDEILLEMTWNAPDWMDVMTYDERNDIEWSIDSIGTSAKDTRFSNVCTEAKNAGVIIFTVGLNVSTSSATLLSNCASSDLNYFDVSTSGVTSAFQSIAAQINQLRLIQ